MSNFYGSFFYINLSWRSLKITENCTIQKLVYSFIFAEAEMRLGLEYKLNRTGARTEP